MRPDEPADPMVGPVLEAGDTGRAVASAILRENPQATLQNHHAYLRVLCPRRCSVSRAAIEAVLGRGFRLPGELEQVMPSFRGRLSVDDDQAAWTLRRRP